MHECEEVVLPNKVIGLFRDIMLLPEQGVHKQTNKEQL
jgi:hypothetical protein